MAIKKGEWVRINNPEVYGEVVDVKNDPSGSSQDQFYKIAVAPVIYKRENQLEVLPSPGPSQKQNYENFLKLNEEFKKNPTIETASVLSTAYMVIFPAPEKK
jgi:hypothetical protein